MHNILRLTTYMATLFCLIGCSGNEYQNFNGVVWNTTYSITYCGASDMRDSALITMRDVELSLSPFNKASLISAINRNETDSVDNNIAIVFEESKRINKLSHGAFDPSGAPLFNLWGFGHKEKENEIPSATDIDSALSLVGISECRIENGHLIKKSPLTEFNFSAITKGFGVDAVGNMLHRNGIESYMVEIGGEIILKGKNPKGGKWRIQIDAPVENNTTETHSRLSVIEVSDCAIATSGNYRNFRIDENGNKIGHTISPVTGLPVLSKTLSATIIAPTCMLADALATACMAMDENDALKMIEGIENVSCMLVSTDESGKYRIIKSSRFPD